MSSSSSSSSSPSSEQKSSYDYVILLVVALCAYLLATIGTQQLSKDDATIEDGGVLPLGPRTDRATGIVFPERETFGIVNKTPMTLLGVGTRKKAILNIYSLGVYASKPLVKQWKNTKAIPSKGPDRCQAILDTKSPKAVQLTFAMGIGPDKIAEAISGLQGVKEQVRRDFHDMIVKGLGGKMLKGESMSFEWKGDNVIGVSARGKEIGSMKDKKLAQGVLGLYVGPKSVSPSLLDDLNCR